MLSRKYLLGLEICLNSSLCPALGNADRFDVIRRSKRDDTAAQSIVEKVSSEMSLALNEGKTNCAVLRTAMHRD
ncbi:unnamed protein product [Ceratitis capitata]|uniref:(Mediterranean fruit fly) hypothetical protein n=1 Tax=Ceratitis capitata TaxID=7213 RepID=A0A811UK63_CERCA|nr:unnamed protein product [Ceratitis capitata]